MIETTRRSFAGARLFGALTLSALAATLGCADGAYEEQRAAQPDELAVSLSSAPLTFDATRADSCALPSRALTEGARPIQNADLSVAEFSRDRALFDAKLALGENCAEIPLRGTATPGRIVQARIVDEQGEEVVGWRDVDDAGADGAWSGLVAVGRRDHWMRIEVRHKARAAAREQMSRRFGTGLIVSMHEQSNLARALLTGSYYNDPSINAPITDPEAVQFVMLEDRGQVKGPDTGRVSPFRHVSDQQPFSTSMTHFAAQVIQAAPGLKTLFVFDAKSGVTQNETLNDDTDRRKFSLVKELFDAVRQDGAEIGVMVQSHNNGIGDGVYAQYLSRSILGKELDGTPIQKQGGVYTYTTSGHRLLKGHHLWTEAMPGLATGRTRVVISDRARENPSLEAELPVVLQAGPQLQANTALSPNPFVAGLADSAMRRGVVQPDGSIRDTTHFTSGDRYGMPQLSRQRILTALEATGILVGRRPTIDRVLWTPDYVELESFAGPMTTLAKQLGEPDRPRNVIGFQGPNSEPFSRVEIVDKTTGQPAKEGVLRIYPDQGTFDENSKVYYFGRLGQAESTGAYFKQALHLYRPRVLSGPAGYREMALQPSLDAEMINDANDPNYVPPERPDAPMNPPSMGGGAGSGVLEVVSVTATAHQSGRAPQDAVDGDMTTRWSAEGDGVTITFDLGAEYDLSAVRTAWFRGDERVQSFELHAGAELNALAPIFDGTSSGQTLGLEPVAIAPAEGVRYVKLIGRGNTLNAWTSLFEIVFEGEPSDDRIAVDSVVATDEDGVNVAANAIDGDLTTRWSGEGDGVAITFDFGAEYDLAGASVAWFKGDERVQSFELLAGAELNALAPIFDGTSSGQTLELEEVAINPVQARYVRLVGRGNTSQYGSQWTSVSEIAFHGRLATASAPGGGGMNPGGTSLSSTPFDVMVPAGFPDSTTTGPLTPIDQMQVHQGDLVTTHDGQIIEKVLVTGKITIEHDHVTVRDCRVYGAKNDGIRVLGQGAVIEDCEIGRQARYATLTQPVAQGAGPIVVDEAVPVGAYLMLSSQVRERQILRVTQRAGSGPYTLQLERHYAKRVKENGKNVEREFTEPADIKVAHPVGAFISYFDPNGSEPLPGNGVSGTANDYDVRRCDIHHVNDGIKVREGVYEDNYIHELIYIPKAHLDSVQATYGVGAVVRHNTLMLPLDANGVMTGSSQGPLRDMTIEYNYITGGGFGMRWGSDGGVLRHNRYGVFTFGPLHIYAPVDDLRDNRFVDGGGVVGRHNDPNLGDRDGDGSGSGDAWGTGYDPAYALPGN